MRNFQAHAPSRGNMIREWWAIRAGRSDKELPTKAKTHALLLAKLLDTHGAGEEEVARQLAER